MQWEGTRTRSLQYLQKVFFDKNNITIFETRKNNKSLKDLEI